MSFCAPMSALGGKADMLFALHMSAFDPKRTQLPAKHPLLLHPKLLRFETKLNQHAGGQSAPQCVSNRDHCEVEVIGGWLMGSLQPVLSACNGRDLRACENCSGLTRLVSWRPHPSLNRLDVRIFECMGCKKTRQFLTHTDDELSGS
jgi:hypothetical protein